jgi:hypothetical protein
MKDPAAQWASLTQLHGELMGKQHFENTPGNFDSVNLSKGITSMLETLGKDKGNAATVKEKKAALKTALAMKDTAAQWASLMQLKGELMVLSQTGLFDPANALKVQVGCEKGGLSNAEIHAEVRLMPSNMSTTNIPQMCDWLMANSSLFAETYTTRAGGRKRLTKVFGTDEEKEVIARISLGNKIRVAAKREPRQNDSKLKTQTQTRPRPRLD